MPNLFDYLWWRGDLPLSREPFNPVDGLILSWFASLKLKNPLPETLGEAAGEIPAEGEGLRFARMLAESPRFREMQLRGFEEKFSEAEEMQFAAVTILTGDARAFIAFRGTDSTLVGWKEDFNMAFSEEVPAQREAVRYINEIGGALGLPLRVGGHSKGGNLAVYAASRCSPGVQRRIGTVFNFDGPGLNASTAESPGYRAVEERIETFLPESSIVGILLERSQRYHVVRSSAGGVMQHSPYTWQVMPNGFELLDALDWQSLYADRTIRDWLRGISMENRKMLVDGLYEIVESTGADTLDEFSEKWQQAGWTMLNAFKELDLRTKAVLFVSLGKLIRSAVRNWNTTG